MVKPANDSIARQIPPMQNQIHEQDNKTIPNRPIVFLAQKLRHINSMTLNQLKWLTVLAPPILIGAFEFTRHSSSWEGLLPVWAGNLLEMSFVMIGTLIFSRIVFGVIERLISENEHRRREAEALLEIGTDITRLLDIEPVLRMIVERARRLLGSDATILCLKQSRDNEGVNFAATSGVTPEQLEVLQKLPPDFHLPMRAALLNGKPSVELCPAAASWSVKGHLTVPLMVAEHTVGSLCVWSKTRSAFTPDETMVLTGFANLAAIAIENTRLHARSRQAAILEERVRIAGELHDHLAQTLNYANLKASIANDQLMNGNTSEAQSNLSELKAIATDALTDVREAIYNLRADLAPAPGLVPALEEYIRVYQAHYSMDVRLATASGFVENLDRDVQIQVIRIIQEALANARKHAAANEVWIRIEQKQGEYYISIEDNGIGFDPNQLMRRDRPYFGLQMMRERAENMGGALDLDSRPGSGTRVTVRVPVSAPGGF